MVLDWPSIGAACDLSMIPATDYASWTRLITTPIGLERVDLVVATTSAHEHGRDSLCAAIQKSRGYESPAFVVHQFLSAKIRDGGYAWYGPLRQHDFLDLEFIAELLAQWPQNMSLNRAVGQLSLHRVQHPVECSAIEGLLWDAMCRSQGLSLQEALSRCLLDQQPSLPEFYASLLGPRTYDQDTLLDALARYAIVKCGVYGSIEARTLAKYVRWCGSGDRIALDGLNNLSPSDLDVLSKHRFGIAWLEDPFPVSSEFWHIVSRFGECLPVVCVGEWATTVFEIGRLAALPKVGLLNLEVERLGIAQCIVVITLARMKGKTVQFHGRLPVTATQLAAASGIAAKVEIHASFVFERMASVLWAVPNQQKITLAIEWWSKQVGCAPIPEERHRSVARLL